LFWAGARQSVLDGKVQSVAIMGAGVVRETTHGAEHGGGDETQFIAALRAGEEPAFVQLIDRYHAGLVRLAHVFVRDAAVAEEVAQETWLGVLCGLNRFEARSSLKRWISSILINGAKTRAMRERRSIPFSALTDDTGLESFAPSVDPERFSPDDAERCRGGWVSFPRDWHNSPDEEVLSRETQNHIHGCIEALPVSQRDVVLLRDVHGMTADETCALLRISEGNQRVLLHRGRAKVRGALELYLSGT
jgi:RNA polymerase sigma-70 factor, ECF subfamily